MNFRNLAAQALTALAEKKIAETRSRTEALLLHLRACTVPIETFAREARSAALAKIDALLRESGFGAATDADANSAAVEAAGARAKIEVLENRLRQLEAELQQARANAARPAATRPSKSSRRKSAVTADAPRMDA